jgi:hypothetical protein
MSELTVFELRINNLLKQGKVRSMYYNNSLGLDDGYCYPVDVLYPIPLTPEILEKAGFEYAAGFADSYNRHPITLYNNPFKEGWTVENLFEQQIKDDLLVIQHVHQLQNLYFALTGKELTINL